MAAIMDPDDYWDSLPTEVLRVQICTVNWLWHNYDAWLKTLETVPTTPEEMKLRTSTFESVPMTPDGMKIPTTPEVSNEAPGTPDPNAMSPPWKEPESWDEVSDQELQRQLSMAFTRVTCWEDAFARWRDANLPRFARTSTQATRDTTNAWESSVSHDFVSSPSESESEPPHQNNISSSSAPAPSMSKGTHAEVHWWPQRELARREQLAAARAKAESHPPAERYQPRPAPRTPGLGGVPPPRTPLTPPDWFDEEHAQPAKKQRAI